MSWKSGLYALLFMRICRAYARTLGNKPADSMMCVLSSFDFFKVHGYWPNFMYPRTFEEKVCHRMLFDRDQRWTMLSDKLYLRDYVANRIGSDYLVPLLWSGEGPEEIPFDDFPSKFVIKANHGCAYNIIVTDKMQLCRDKAVRQLKRWLSENFGRDRVLGTAWAYKNITPAIMVEEFLEENGNVPLDYKFFCFSGRAEFIQMNFDRFGDAWEKTLDREFMPLDLWQGTRQYEGEISRPNNFAKMIRVAETLSEGLDFIRVDMYNVRDRLYVGELSCYPGGGRIRFIPRKYDFILGEKWK